MELSALLIAKREQLLLHLLELPLLLKIAVVVPIVGAQIAALKAGFIGITVASRVSLGSLVAYKATLAATSAGFATASAAATAFKIAIAKLELVFCYWTWVCCRCFDESKFRTKN